MNPKNNPSTSWESSHLWYDKIVGEKGHYYHQEVVLPNALRLLSLKPQDSLLDLGCGQGVLSRSFPPSVHYVGVDASPSLIQTAQHKSRHSFYVSDLTEPLSLKEAPFSHAAMLLVVQNLHDLSLPFQNAASLLKPHGKFLIVMNHPAFRIPRQSSWGIDADKKLQYRRIDLYMSPLQIPIQTHPGKGGASTLSFHRPLSSYIQALAQAGFLIQTIEEWTSNKTSTGGKAAMENRSRREFPLFLALVAIKQPRDE